MYFKRLLTLLLIICILAPFNICQAFAGTTPIKVVSQKKPTIDLKKISTYDKFGKSINVKTDAIALYEYAVSLNPKNADTLANLGNV